jgi:hypothetical protein
MCLQKSQLLRNRLNDPSIPVCSFRAYLDLQPARARRTLTKVTLSDHELASEALTRETPVVPREQRACRLCRAGVEDPAHILLVCPDQKLVSLRDALHRSHPELLDPSGLPSEQPQASPLSRLRATLNDHDRAASAAPAWTKFLERTYEVKVLHVTDAEAVMVGRQLARFLAPGPDQTGELLHPPAQSTTTFR